MDQKWPCRAHCSENTIWNDKNRNISGKRKGSCRSVFRRCKRIQVDVFCAFQYDVLLACNFHEDIEEDITSGISYLLFLFVSLLFYIVSDAKPPFATFSTGKNKKTRFLYKVTFITAQYRISLRIFAGYSGIGILFSFFPDFHVGCSQNHSIICNKTY